MSTSNDRRRKTVSEVRNVAVDMRGKLDAGELLTGAPVITEVSTADLSFSNQAVNIAPLTIKGKTVGIGQAVQFKVTGGVRDTQYTIRIQVGTTAAPAQTLVENVILTVIPD